MAAFFNTELEKKNRCPFDMDTFEGYIAMDTENYGSGTHELHEGLVLKTDGVVDEPEIPSLKPAVTASLKSYRALSNTIMTALSLSLGKDPDYLASLHKDRGTANSSTSMRVNYYPPVPSTVAEGTTRFGAHRDYSTLSFIVQDNTGGLQVQDTEGSWLDVNPIPGTIILLAGEFFVSYSGDKFIAPLHRVIISAEELQRSVPRITTNYFVHADHQVPFKLLDSSSTEKSMTVKEYLSSRIMQALNKSTKE
ncbi:2-oxoglutarate-Fe(II) type oxidoreductase-like [Homarus americanus]|nr:2-oxoglutarate-Fe(II) type oxidoreductase-like [Homarus americanus]